MSQLERIISSLYLISETLVLPSTVPVVMREFDFLEESCTCHHLPNKIQAACVREKFTEVPRYAGFFEASVGMHELRLISTARRCISRGEEKDGGSM